MSRQTPLLLLLLPPPLPHILLLLLVLDPQLAAVTATGDMNRLYEDLLFSYNRLARPVRNNSQLVTVKMRLRLSQLIDVVCSHSMLFSLSHYNILLIFTTSERWLLNPRSDRGGVTLLKFSHIAKSAKTRRCVASPGFWVPYGANFAQLSVKKVQVGSGHGAITS